MGNNYTGLRYGFTDETAKKRCAERLLATRRSLKPLRDRRSDCTLMLATWNIRDFDSNKFGYGPRLQETFYYIAEIMTCFDLIAVQEVNRDLSALDKVMKILGHEWDYIVTDTTAGSGGNSERMAFVWNTEKVFFRKIAGEVVLPQGQLIVAHKKVKPPKDQPGAAPQVKQIEQQFARSPFLVAFQSGWFRFSLCTVHIYYGSESGAQLQQRIDEIQRLVEFFAERQDSESQQEKDRLGNIENYILLGDFNVVSPKHKTMEALQSNGFKVPEPIDGDKVRKKGQHFYDQIAVRVKDPKFKVSAGGIVDMFEHVFRDTPEDLAVYSQWVPETDPEKDSKFAAKTREALYRKWRTWQMSDHSPLWIEIQTDFGDDYLERIAAT